MPREITDRERVVQSVKTLAPTSELFDEQNGRQKYESDLEVIVQGRDYGNGKRVGPYVRLLEFDANEEIMRQGEWGGNTFYIAVEGALDVAVADEAGVQTKIGELQPGTCLFTAPKVRGRHLPPRRVPTLIERPCHAGRPTRRPGRACQVLTCPECC